MKKRTLFLAFFAFSANFIFAQLNINDSIDYYLNQKEIKAEERVKNVKKFALRNYQFYEGSYLFNESDLLIFHQKVFPFIEKSVKKAEERNTLKAWFYYFGFEVSSKLRDRVNAQENIQKAVLCIEMPSNDKSLEALIYTQYGYYQMENGDISTAHHYFYKSIEIYDALGMYPQVVDALYHLAINFYEIKDTEGLERVIRQMEKYIEKHSSPNMLFQLNTIKSVYYSELSITEPIDTAAIDSSIYYDKASVALLEKYSDEISEGISPAWTYYNLAISIRQFYPHMKDTISYYLNKAIEVTEGKNRNDELEIYISIHIVLAEDFFNEGNFNQAEKEAHWVLSLLEKYEDFNVVLAEYHELYVLLVKIYEQKGDLGEALRYQRLLQENEKKRYDNDKIMAINEMSVKFEVEMKESQIALLEEQNRTSRLTGILFASLAFILLITTVFIIFFYRFKKKSFEQNVYESALEAELKQNELESLRRKIEEKTTQSGIDKIADFVRNSPMPKDKRENYLKLLSELNIETIEKGYLAEHDKITIMDMKYIICFAIDMDVKDIGLLFNVEPASVRTVRYRIRKKLGENHSFHFLI